MTVMMKRILAAWFLLLGSSSLFAQTENVYPRSEWFGDGEFVITGKMQNKPDHVNSWSLAVTDYLSSKGHEIPVEADGSFEKSLPITDVQDIYLYLRDAVTIFSFPGDTIWVTFDNENPLETLSLKGTSQERSNELELCLEIYRNFREDYLNISNIAYNPQGSIEERAAALNEYYDKKISLINAFEAENGPLPFSRKFRDATYFEAAFGGIRGNELLPKLHFDSSPVTIFSLRTTDGVTDTIPEAIPPYQVLDYTTFRTVPAYRDFLEPYLYFQNKNIFTWSNGYPETDGRAKHIAQHKSEERYDFAKNSLRQIPPIRDWYLADLVSSMLTYERIETAEPLYLDFLNICEDDRYLSVLTPKYQKAIALASGKPAPDFELRNLDGNTVRLSDFKGKIVYMDFWGVGCSPCIYEFKTSKEEFMRKYGSEDIVLIYICVDSKEPQWRRAVEQHKLEGVNLIAEGWVDNPVCQLYNVDAIPHYVLIDKEGNIVRNHCDRPSDYVRNGNNELDKLLLRL